MKKIVTTMLAVAGFTAYVNAQGSFIIDSGANHGNGATPTSTSGGLVFINGVLDTGTDINLAILYGTSAGAVNTFLDIATPSGGNTGSYTGNTSWIASQGTGSGDITFNGNGTITDPNGETYVLPTAAGLGVGSTVFFNIEAWTGGASSYSAVTTSGPNAGLLAQSGVFSLVMASQFGPIQPDTSSMGSLNLVAAPEPTTLALAGLGGAALLAFRRRKA